MLNCSPQAVRRPSMCEVTYTHDCDPFEIRLCAPFPLLFGSRKFPPHCCVRLQWFVPLVFVAFLCGCGFNQPAFSVSLKRRQQSSRGPIRLSSPGHTRFVCREPHMKAAGLAGLQGLTGTPVCPRNFQCDHRSNPVRCVHLELAKADLRADVY